LLPVSRVRGWGLCFLCALPVLAGFVLPVLQLLYWSLLNSSYWSDGWNLMAARTSVILSLATAVLACVIAVIFAYAVRREPAMLKWIRPATMGYAVPGSVVAVAVFVPLLLLDRFLADVVEHWQGVRPALFLTGSLFAMTVACGYRFLVVAFGAVDAGLRNISPSVDDAALLLGTSRGRIMRELHWPHLRVSVMAGGLLVFADTMKELPASLLMRPFDVSTLAIRTYSLAQDGLLAQAAVPALLLTGISLLAVMVIAWQQLGLRMPALTRMDAAQAV
jgi:iron(III) transport system permease protein